MYAPPTHGMIRQVLTGIASLGKGLGITFSYMFRKPITVQYPEKRVVLPLRFRGRLVLPVDPGKGDQPVHRLHAVREDLPEPLHRHREGRSGPTARRRAQPANTCTTSAPACSATSAWRCAPSSPW